MPVRPGMSRRFAPKKSAEHGVVCPQRVWFLAPTFELCIQQHQVLSSALPAYCHRLLKGSENLDRWSEQHIWDAALDQHRVVVSTHAVLADALRHGFVRISDLALIIFDEGKVVALRKILVHFVLALNENCSPSLRKETPGQRHHEEFLSPSQSRLRVLVCASHPRSFRERCQKVESTIHAVCILRTYVEET